MAWYRKRSEVIKAYKIPKDWKNDETPSWVLKGWEDGDVYMKFLDNEHMFIDTLGGEFMLSEGDYLVKKARGKLYGCRPNIFDEAYEKIE